MKEFGEKLKELREERGLTMDLLVYDLNNQFNVEISKSNISRWENGTVDPSLKFAKNIADYFGVSLDYMIGNTDVRLPARLLAYANALKKTRSDRKDDEQ